MKNIEAVKAGIRAFGLEVTKAKERGIVMPGAVSCKQCGGVMVKTKKADKNIGLQIVGVLVFLLGLGLLFLFPIGTIAGVILMIVAARLGYKQVKVWKCESCGYFFERAD